MFERDDFSNNNIYPRTTSAVESALKKIRIKELEQAEEEKRRKQAAAATAERERELASFTSQRNLLEEQRRKEEFESVGGYGEKVSSWSGKFGGYINDVANVLTATAFFLHDYNFLLAEIPFIKDVAFGIQIFSTFVGIYTPLLSEKENAFSRGLMMCLGVGFLILGIVSICHLSISATPLLIAGIALSTISNIKDLTISISSYFFGDWKRERKELAILSNNFYKKLSRAKNEFLPDTRISHFDLFKKYRENGNLTPEETTAIESLIEDDNKITNKTNLIREYQGELAKNIFRTAMSAIKSVGAVLVIVAPPIGFAIILGTIAVSITAAIAGKFIKPFGPKEHHASIQDIEDKISLEHPSETPSPKLDRQAIIQRGLGIEPLPVQRTENRPAADFNSSTNLWMRIFGKGDAHRYTELVKTTSSVELRSAMKIKKE